MNKVTKLFLMLSLVLSGAFCYAGGVAGTMVKGDETPAIAIIKTNCGGTDKSGSIIPTLNDKVLMVTFTEDLGQVTIEVATNAGVTVDCAYVFTPNGILFYIPNVGDYIVTFTLPNGDEYYGEFTVTE